MRVRYVTQSAAFGSREFVGAIFARNREKINVKRGAREPNWGCVARQGLAWIVGFA